MKITSTSYMILKKTKDITEDLTYHIDCGKGTHIYKIVAMFNYNETLNHINSILLESKSIMCNNCNMHYYNFKTIPELLALKPKKLDQTKLFELLYKDKL